LRALCILHDSFSTTGLIGAALRERGWTVDELFVVPAWRNESPNIEFAFPDHREYDLLVPMGAPWSAYDDAGIGAWLLPELGWLAGAVRAGAAVFGICFGAQALARALGGAVARLPAPEIGWYEIESADPALVPPGPWLQWHFDGFTPPPGALVLARTEAAVQAYRIGRCLGTQFHPEVTDADVRLWLAHGAQAEALDSGLDPDGLLAECVRQADGARERAGALVDCYLAKIFPG
jgi:GMP synthase-like glutamine amidotransferase